MLSRFLVELFGAASIGFFVAAILGYFDVQQPKQAEKLKLPAELRIEGHYYITGTAGENEYEGLLTIRQQGEVFVFSWNVGGGVGIGIREANTIAVGMESRGNTLGVLLYRVERDDKGKPKLVGRWTSSPGDAKVHTETATWLRELK